MRLYDFIIGFEPSARPLFRSSIVNDRVLSIGLAYSVSHAFVPMKARMPSIRVDPGSISLLDK
jgi:hypothetical protein